LNPGFRNNSVSCLARLNAFPTPSPLSATQDSPTSLSLPCYTPRPNFPPDCRRRGSACGRQGPRSLESTNWNSLLRSSAKGNENLGAGTQSGYPMAESDYMFGREPSFTSAESRRSNPKREFGGLNDIYLFAVSARAGEKAPLVPVARDFDSPLSPKNSRLECAKPELRPTRSLYSEGDSLQCHWDQHYQRLFESTH
jgi:hypothetical protein